jgi:c-di-GMP-binding flagellar brake protein YcgR
MGERRKYERFSLRLATKTTVINSEQKEDEEILDLFTKDICAGGAFFHSVEPLPEGTQVKIDLVLDVDKLKKITKKKAFIRVKGKVVRTESTGMAICFDKNYKITSI